MTDRRTSEVAQGRFGKRGYLNPTTDTWHYLKRCCGERAPFNKMSLEDAVEEGHDLCGNCADRFSWWVES